MSSKEANKLSEAALYEAALRYLDRQDGSVEQVRRSLKRRVVRYGEETARDEALVAVERVLERLVEARLLDDQRFAVGFAEGQRRRGASTLFLRQKLRTRGLSQAHIDHAVSLTEGDDQHNELASALIYAQKRRLVQKYDLNDPLQRNKALSTLARRGFSFDVARRALGL